MNRKQVTMVEHIGEDGSWEWYRVWSKKTEKEAIKDYCKEMSLPCGRIRQELDGFYSQLQEVRAYKVTIY